MDYRCGSWVDACGNNIDFSWVTSTDELTINEKNSMKMVSNHTLSAKKEGAVAMVTPCPLCHLNLDGYQPNASSARKRDIDLPIIHLPQLVGLSLGIAPEKMRLNKHIVSTKKLLSELAVSP